MSFFDGLERFVSDLQKSLKPEEVVKLRSCKKCSYYRKGFCSQTPVLTRILSEYWAQGCLFYSPQEAVVPIPRVVESGLQRVAVGLHWYDRNPVPKLESKSYSLAPHDQTERVKYTCPEGKLAMLEYLGSSVIRATAAAPVGAAYAFWAITPKDGTEKALIDALSWNNTVGVGDKTIHGTQITLYGGDILKGYTGDGSTGGVNIFRLVYKLTEFDA